MPDAYMAHADQATLSVLDLSAPPNGASRIEKVTSHDGLEAGCDTSPDGSKLAYWYPSAGNAINASAIFVTDTLARGPNGLDVTRKLDRSPWVVRWMPNNLSLLILAHDGTREANVAGRPRWQHAAHRHWGLERKRRQRQPKRCDRVSRFRAATAERALLVELRLERRCGGSRTTIAFSLRFTSAPCEKSRGLKMAFAKMAC